MKNLFEYSDILHSPIEAFTCATENVHLPVETGTVLFLHLDGNGKIVPLLWRLLSQKSLNPWIKKGLWNGAREPIHSNPKRRVFLLQSLPKGCPRAQRGHGSSGE